MRLFHSIILLTLLCGNLAYGALTKLKPIITKQDITNLRFISYDGRFSIYQRRSGSLLYSTNYKIAEILKGSAGTQFSVTGTMERKKLIIEERADYFRNFSLRQVSNIYLLNYDGTGLKFFGKGMAARLHLNDTWLSFFDPAAKEIQFANINNDTVRFSVKMNNPFNSYFVPHVVMLNETKVLLTDLNEKGHAALLEFDRKDKKFTTLQKIESAESKIELCLSQTNIFVAHIGVNSSTNHTMIVQYPQQHFSIDNGKIVFESRNNEIGNMICDFSAEKIYLVQMNETSKISFSSEVISVDLASKKTSILSDLNNVTQILNLDGRLVTPYQGKFYMLEGSNNVFDDSLNVPPSSIASDPFIDKIEATPTSPPIPAATKTVKGSGSASGSGSGEK